MIRAAIPVHEDARLAAVEEYDLSSPFGEQAYGPILDLARHVFDVPTAFVSLLGRDRQILPFRRGLDLCETSREVSFCAHAIFNEAMLVVLDATLDPRFADNPLVTGEPHLRFYAGMPLFSPSGHAIGSFCIADIKPHNAFGKEQRERLQELAAIVLDRLELRRVDAARQVGQARFESIASTSPDGIICANASGLITFWNAAAERLFGYSSTEALGHSIDLIVPERMRKGHERGLDRVAKGGSPQLVGRTVELTARRRDGTEFPIELSLSMWQEGTGIGFGSIVRDITQRRANEENLIRLAHLDPLTELPNRVVLRRRVEQLASSSAKAALLLVDLDGFKNVNDDLGHTIGDAVLRQVAERLLSGVRPTDTVARLGGDEFAIVLPDTSSADEADEVAQTLIHKISRPMTVDGRRVNVCASIGSAIYPDDGANTDELLSSADLALYQAKKEGRLSHFAFTPALRQAADLARAYDDELQHAFERGEFEVFYQPQVRLTDDALVGAEALLRWRHPHAGLLSPAAFMSALDSRPLSADVGRWTLHTAAAQAQVWRLAGIPEFRIGVNLFGSQFRVGDLAVDACAVLDNTGLPGSALELEITENIILRHDETMLRPLRAVRELGVGIAFDDYGTGFGSLSMLRRLPVTRLKIDRSFVRDICEIQADAAIVRSILFLGRSLGLEVIAEGVETPEQAERLRRKGCPEAQGYLFRRPMTAVEFAAQFGLHSAAA